MHIAIESQTDAATSNDLKLEHVPGSVVASDLATTETVKINIKDADDEYVEVYELTASEPTRAIYSPGTYQFVKSATASACSVGVASSRYDV